MRLIMRDYGNSLMYLLCQTLSTEHSQHPLSENQMSSRWRHHLMEHGQRVLQLHLVWNSGSPTINKTKDQYVNCST